MAITRKDVARRAGVSVATVSYVLNNSASISSATREKVLQAAEELNYIPNQVARSLSTAVSKQISVCIDNINNPYYGEIGSLFEKNAIEQGCFVNVCTKPQYMETYFTNILSRHIDGLFLMVVPNGEIADSLQSIVARGIPVAASGFFTSTSGISLIDPDFETGMLQIVRYLADRGHSRIVYLSCFEHDCMYDTRVECFEKACVKVFGENNQSRVFAPEAGNMTSNEETGYRLTKKLLEGPGDFTAVVTTGDLMAIGCMAALKNAGKNIPADVSVMGIDGIVFGEYVRPSLTTLMLDKENLAGTALKALFKQRAGGGITVAKTGFSICERQSVASCK
jgi:DNA-binding LacI/PurR family transcriptional regulator